MKRSPLKYGILVKIKQAKPWFWKTCDKCGDQYKKEQIWKLIIEWEGPIVPLPNPHTTYLCSHCCPSKDVVISFLKTQIQILYRWTEERWGKEPKLIIL